MNLDAVFDAGMDGGFEYDEGNNDAFVEECEQEHQGAVSAMELESILQKKEYMRFHEKLNLPINMASFQHFLAQRREKPKTKSLLFF